LFRIFVLQVHQCLAPPQNNQNSTLLS
jgi:hypothetical protein